MILPLLLGLACGPKAPPVAPTQEVALVRYRPAEPTDEAGRFLVQAIPDAQWDAGLQAAAQAMLGAHLSRTARLDPLVASLASARAGFPGQARFLRALTGGAFPDALLDRIEATGPVDLGMAVRRFEDGTALWILAWAPHLAEVDPLPRDLPLDGRVGLRVDLPDHVRASLFLAGPSGPVREIGVVSGAIRWLEGFDTPGAWRVELVREEGEGRGSVALLFSLFVDGPPPALGALPEVAEERPDPRAAEVELMADLNALRAEHGLPAVAPFPLFEPLVREHTALMAAAGHPAHALPGITPGVAVEAANLAHPRADHHEAVAVGANAREALGLVLDSPAHLDALLCAACTHAVIGAALEPVLDRTPRLFLTWELLEMPQGPPQKIDRPRR